VAGFAQTGGGQHLAFGYRHGQHRRLSVRAGCARREQQVVHEADWVQAQIDIGHRVRFEQSLEPGRQLVADAKARPQALDHQPVERFGAGKALIGRSPVRVGVCWRAQRLDPSPQRRGIAGGQALDRQAACQVKLAFDRVP
jgi:hypothetical protein